MALVSLNSTVGGKFLDDFDLPGSDSQAALDLLEDHGFAARAGFSGQVVIEAAGVDAIGSGAGVRAPEVEQAVEAFLADVERTMGPGEIISPYDPAGAQQISDDGTIAYAEINLDDRDSDEYTRLGEDIRGLADAATANGDLPAGSRIELGGDIFAEPPQFASEGIGFLAAMVILLLAFGSVLAMGLPIITAVFGIVTGISIVGLAVHLMDMPSFTASSVAMIGIGVGIDYALFIVTRYREGLQSGLDPERATVRAIDTAGRAVIFAGTTVIIAVLGMFTIGLAMIRGSATAIAIGVLMTMLASVTLLPAILGFVGRNIDRLGLPHRRRGEGADRRSIGYRWSRLIQRRPWPALVVATVVLVLLAAPVFGIRLGFGDAGNRPTSDTTRQAYDLLSDGFGDGFNGPFLLAAETPGGAGDRAVLDDLSARLNHTEGVRFATDPQPNEAGDAAIIQLFPTTSPQDQATEDLVHRLRDQVIPAAVDGSNVDVKVGGATPAVVDFSEYSAGRLPWFIGVVLVLSFLLLMVVFRSVLVPLKAVVMNLLSVGAAYGILVAVFQWGWGSGLLAVGREGPIDAWIPMSLFAVIFGLSMDYEVFLLSRIREDYDRSHDNPPPDPTRPPMTAPTSSALANSEAVANGLAATARVITAAAAIMFCVFFSFVLGADRSLKMFGLGLAMAVLLDATIVRMVLVPATMELLGDRNWWLPRWLDRILPNVHIEARDPLDADPEGAEREQVSASV
ncbi:MAG TPA: MMPL family transporter [Acidimicrobiales bacterium]|nr:MMPL family transporter [Acidimicrobiales bacterium]